MTQRPTNGRIHLPFLLVLVGYAMAGLQLWPSVHVALSNASVFVDYNTDCNGTGHNLTISLVDIGSNTTLLTRYLPYNQSEGRMEFDCSCFLYAGSFRFLLERTSDQNALANGSATWWWSPVLQISWPTFHISVEQANNRTSGSFQIGVSTNDHFHACAIDGASRLLLEVTYLEYNQIGKNNINKIRAQTEHEITTLRSQHVDLDCVFPFTEHDFIRVALKSPHTQQEIKASVPLYLSRIFPYKLLVDSNHRSGCNRAVTVRLVPPPCAFTYGRVFVYRDGASKMTGSGSSSSGTEEATLPAHLAYNWLTQGENETEFNCSVFDPGKNKYCFRFILNSSRSPSPAQTCTVVQRIAETWGPWQPWSRCSVTCGEGIRERTRKCLVPSGGAMIRCTGLVKEQSHCSLEDCVVPVPVPSMLPPKSGSSLQGNLVGLAGISLCLAVIVATILITVWRKVCRAAKCSSVRRSSVHSPGGRKNSDEASICGHSLQRPSFSDSLQAAPALLKGPPLAAGVSSPPERVFSGGHQQNLSLPLTLSPQDPERLSPSGQKIVPPIFGYRLAQQQLKEMKKRGLKEATKVYHVSQSPIDDTMLEALESTQSGLTATQQDSESQDDSNLSRYRIKSPFLEGAWTPSKASKTLPDRLGPKADYSLGSPTAGFSAQKRERTADWVEMVERSGVGLSKNPNFRRTSSFHETKLHQQSTPVSAVAARPFRERSMTQVTPRQIPEGSCKTRGAWEQPPPIRESEPWAPGKPRTSESTTDSRRRPWIEASPCLIDLKANTGGLARSVSAGTDTSARPVAAPVERHRGDVPSPPPALGLSRAEQAEQNWNRRGPSPIQRNILARKLREANANPNANANNANAAYHRQRSATFSATAQRRDRCRSLPLSGDYSNACASSPYGLSEAEKRMIDLPGHLGEEGEGVEPPPGLGMHRRT
ncbi:hypothetical protein AALO_G00024640 [Alosa alosa]|uniref:Thrombospondin type-1 domain-containing protein 1 n=1 Tax=Alosa alosa TaxID=278164 RepID=A0AAV6HDZ7_9TELE|nr:thrombospondin type-1 domain-containing protein 1 isoform X1 [Alosa alosa]XP_048092608.1 thrombospondin type-1 domain-containing protein 1 isoform X1 [Alosa alosa]XP_048092611.1 thrombospondin type-1 domain-containing protein 1 isoform X1 [Alosa alosa]XP_048092619.1 thrombospondin type-1 domain-containing protein 1 isoform X1 [Alosa alosa]XP_048092626.1 thrombospondin type-1 domain-containing protein 1 isoform X1 [Alosa alosa]KAG5284255.1 hypothetical protein AALO_G00024640 [Alosa alosa]